jgi:hypothetical protein
LGLASIGININSALGEDSPFREEREIAFPFRIPTEHILGAYRVQRDGSMIIPLPNLNWNGVVPPVLPGNRTHGP